MVRCALWSKQYGTDMFYIIEKLLTLGGPGAGPGPGPGPGPCPGPGPGLGPPLKPNGALILPGKPGPVNKENQLLLASSEHLKQTRPFQSGVNFSTYLSKTLQALKKTWNSHFNLSKIKKQWTSK